MFLYYLFAGIVLVNLSFLPLFLKFVFHKEEMDLSMDVDPVSLIVCAKNEAAALSENIPLWLNQDHPYFELILVNDASSDESLTIMESYSETDPRVKVVDVQNNETFWGKKKYALTLGIKKAKYENMVFTDADCKPNSVHWLRIMNMKFTDNKQIVLGYGAYTRSKGWLNKVIRFETLVTALQYFSYALNGIPYMGVGRNLGYSQQIFYKNRGFMQHMDISSGDDDLFVNQAANALNTEICLDRRAFTISTPKKTWKEWILQKRRHISTAVHYRIKHKLLLATFYLSNLAFWILALLSFAILNWKITLGIIIIRLIPYWIVIGKTAKKLEHKDLVVLYPFLDIFLIFAQLIIFISNSIAKPARWK